MPTKISTQDRYQINELIHAIKWHDGFTIQDQIQSPILESVPIHVTIHYQIIDPIQFKNFIMEYADDLNLTQYLHQPDADAQLIQHLNDLALDGLLDYAQGIQRLNYQVKTD